MHSHSHDSCIQASEIDEIMEQMTQEVNLVSTEQDATIKKLQGEVQRWKVPQHHGLLHHLRHSRRPPPLPALPTHTIPSDCRLWPSTRCRMRPESETSWQLKSQL